MILYHTGPIEIPRPDIRHGRANADFGQGFYLTPDHDFTYRWARQGAVVNRYELETEDLRVHTFSRTAEWYEYIFRNRRGKDTLDADVVIGPIANDTIFETLGLFSSGFLPSEEALALLMIGPEYTQVAVKTRKAADRLQWMGAERMADAKEYEALLRREQEAYQAQLAAAMERLMETDEAQGRSDRG